MVMIINVIIITVTITRILTICRHYFQHSNKTKKKIHRTCVERKKKQQ